MLQYLKDRFKEYISYGKTKEAHTPYEKQGTSEDLYVDFEITYDQTDIIVDAFSMTKKELGKDFVYFMKQNLADVLEIDKGNIHLVSKIDDSFYFDIDYEGKSQYIRHKVSRIPDQRHQEDEIVYNDIDEQEEEHNPYTDGAWGSSTWHCIRCGAILSPIPQFDEWWGELAWHAMRRDHTQWFVCTNEKCCHSDSPLILHHPDSKGYGPAGDSYSISYIK